MMTDKEELKALLMSYKESPSRGIRDEIAIAKIELLLENSNIIFCRTERLPDDYDISKDGFILENPDSLSFH